MNLAELKEAYKARKLALDSAKKEEEKYKALLKDAMLEAGESDYTDEAGYRFERIVQERKSMDEEKLLAELHERNLTSCIATKEVVDEDATLKAVEAGELPQEVLADELAHRVGIGRQAISAIENGGDFKTQTLDNLAIVLGVSVDFIMYGKNEENSELLSEAMDVLSDMDELQIRQCLAMMKAMKSVSVGK